MLLDSLRFRGFAVKTSLTWHIAGPDIISRMHAIGALQYTVYIQSAIIHDLSVALWRCCKHNYAVDSQRG